MKVLVIEDNQTDSKLMVAVLQASGNIVHASMSAEAALDAVLTEKPDVIMLDLRLPGMDGLAFIRRFKINSGARQVPIVAMTAFPDRYGREELLAAGCDAYIAKPIDTRQLPKQLAAMTGM
jgi:CheY-like chemotaxis protein